MKPKVLQTPIHYHYVIYTLPFLLLLWQKCLLYKLRPSTLILYQILFLLPSIGCSTKQNKKTFILHHHLHHPEPFSNYFNMLLILTSFFFFQKKSSLDPLPFLVAALHIFFHLKYNFLSFFLLEIAVFTFPLLFFP